MHDKKPQIKDILSVVDSDNIVSELDEDFLRRLAIRVEEGYNMDLASSEEWLRDVKRVEELAILQSKKKSHPLPNSSNVKLPLITKACYEYSSRVYPEIFKNDTVVKTNIIGRDFTGEKELKARKVAQYMNWQLYWDDEMWRLEHRRLLNRLAMIGFLCKKTYFDPVRKKVRSELCEPQDLIINSNVKSLDDAYRITHVLHVKLNDLIEGARAGIYDEEVVDKLIDEYAPKETQNPEDRNENPHIDLLEQHTFIDLDGDDYEEPYIVTTVKDKSMVLRVIPRFNNKTVKKEEKEIKYIDAIQNFTDYHFLVSPRGKFQSVGFGILLLHITESANTVLNQLIDAGQLANSQGGFIDARLKGAKSGNNKFDPGEFKYMKTMGGMLLKDGILPIDYKEPSNVLYQLLGLLIDVSRDLSASSDIMTGQSSPENSKTGATQALIAEGVKIHNDINSDHYRSLGNEFYKIYVMNSMYLDPQEATRVIGEEISLEDFNTEQVDVIPVADPNLASAQKQAAEIQKLMFIGTMPGVDPLKVTERVVKAVIEKDPEELMVDQTKEQPPNPEAIKIQAEIQNMAELAKLKGHELELREKELEAKNYEVLCKCLDLKAAAMLKMAQAESLEAGNQLQLYMKQLDMLSQHMENQMRVGEMGHERDIQNAQQMHEQMMQQQEMQNQPPEEPTIE